MIGLVLACCGLASAAPEVIADRPAAATSPADRAGYEAERARAGRDAASQVRLALWCEANGLEAEKLRHLALAVLVDPSHQVARGLLGVVADAGRWASPEKVADRVGADGDLAAKRAEYDARRSGTAPTADAQIKLAAWCEAQGLSAEAVAHYTHATRLDPSREIAWRKLGCRRYEDRWLRPDQIEAIRADREAQARADKHWMSALAKLRGDLFHPARRDEAAAALDGLAEPRSVPAIIRVFGRGDARDQAVAVRLLGQVDSHEASQALATLSIFGETGEIRRLATETLRRRDLKGILSAMIGLFRAPIRYEMKPSDGPGSPGVLLIEGEKANLARVYEAPREVSFATRAAGRDNVEQRTEAANAPLLTDARSIDARNERIVSINDRARLALRGVTGIDRGETRDGWMAWWSDLQGYAFQSSTLPGGIKPTIYQNVSSFGNAYDCFGAGTAIRTIDGPRSIESIKVGDRVLTQDVQAGTLSFEPVVAVYKSPPAETLRVGLKGGGIVVLGIHRFWKAGVGWTMARDLKAGDPVRHLGGVARVESVAPDRAQEVFNLEVARNSSFFAGEAAALVHDNSIVRPVERPFDAIGRTGPVAKVAR